MFYNVQKGNKKTPMHWMTTLCIHEKCKSRKLITCVNRMDVCVSHKEVKEIRRNLAQFTGETSSTVLSLPSHFVRDSFTINAMDNFDHNEATLSGLNSCHDTVMVLFQEGPKLFKISQRLLKQISV